MSTTVETLNLHIYMFLIDILVPYIIVLKSIVVYVCCNMFQYIRSLELVYIDVAELGIKKNSGHFYELLQFVEGNFQGPRNLKKTYYTMQDEVMQI